MRETPLNLWDRYLLGVLGFTTGSGVTSMAVEGEMKVEAVGHGPQHILLRLTLPGGQELASYVARWKLPDHPDSVVGEHLATARVATLPV